MKVTKEQLTGLYKEDIVEGFEGWSMETDTSEGEFDAEKGAMCDYEITLISPEGKQFVGEGGYYTACTGEMFNYDIDFDLVEDERSSVEMTFSEALDEMKEMKHVKRPNWEGYIAICYNYVKGLNKPFIYANCKDGEIVPAVINNLDMLAEDWEIVE